jgi:hypothetical protein
MAGTTAAWGSGPDEPLPPLTRLTAGQAEWATESLRVTSDPRRWQILDLLYERGAR